MSDLSERNTEAPTPLLTTRMGLVRWMALLVLVGLFGVYVLASIWERYSANDYCYVGYAAAYGPLLGRWQYDRFIGTITSLTAFGTIVQYQHGPTGLLTALILAGWLAMTWLALRRITLFRGKAALVSLVLIVATLDIAPAVGQDFYWESGLFEYGFTLLLLTMTFWWVTRPDHAQMRLVNILGVVITAALTASSSTLGAILFPALFAGLWVVLPPEARALRRNLAAAFIGAMIGTVIVVAAPGNAIRAATFPPRNFPASVVAGVVNTGLPIVDAVTRSPAGAIALVALLILTGAIVGADRMQIEGRSRTALIILVAILGSCALSEFVFWFSASSTDYSMFGRGELFPLCVLVVGLALLSIVIRRPAWLRSRAVTGGTFVVFAAASLIRAGTLIGSMATYAQQWDVRDAAIRSGIMSVPALHIFDRSDVETDWVLGCVRQYYGAPVQPLAGTQ
ncbi:MAG: DUF6056 family protein [Aggregatilineales bacterium]